MGFGMSFIAKIFPCLLLQSSQVLRSKTAFQCFQLELATVNGINMSSFPLVITVPQICLCITIVGTSYYIGFVCITQADSTLSVLERPSNRVGIIALPMSSSMTPQPATAFSLKTCWTLQPNGRIISAPTLGNGGFSL